jgi:menaquinone-dependent protoporphyrinogen IX oxidase
MLPATAQRRRLPRQTPPLRECGLSVELQLLREVRVLTGYGAIVMDAPLKWFAGDEPSSDIRDWTAIRAWAGDLAEKFEFALS